MIEQQQADDQTAPRREEREEGSMEEKQQGRLPVQAEIQAVDVKVHRAFAVMCPTRKDDNRC
jgi:hypothetical protein